MQLVARSPGVARDPENMCLHLASSRKLVKYRGNTQVGGRSGARRERKRENKNKNLARKFSTPAIHCKQWAADLKPYGSCRRP